MFKCCVWWCRESHFWFQVVKHRCRFWVLGHFELGTWLLSLGCSHCVLRGCQCILGLLQSGFPNTHSANTHVEKSLCNSHFVLGLLQSGFANSHFTCRKWLFENDKFGVCCSRVYKVTIAKWLLNMCVCRVSIWKWVYCWGVAWMGRSGQFTSHRGGIMGQPTSPGANSWAYMGLVGVYLEHLPQPETLDTWIWGPKWIEI